MAVSVVLVGVLVEACAQAGVPAERLLGAAGLEASRLGDNDGLVSLLEYERVQAAAVELTGDPALGLHIGERSNFSGFEVAAGLIASAESLRAALRAYLRFQRIFGEQYGSVLTESGDTATLRYEFPRGSAAYNRFRAELSMVCFLRLVGHSTGGGGKVDVVRFEHARPEHAAEYTRLFGGAERFEQPFTGIEFRRELLDRGSLHTDPEFHATLEVLAQRRLSRLERGTSVRTRVAEYVSVAARHSGQRPDAADVAKHLGMSPRSLRRRLSVEGVAFARVCDEAMAELAKSMLSDPKQSITSAAFALGFSDSSAFHRAFKRWTGITPKQFRDQL
jgi:AraC-like DNA-binding protein